VIALRHAIGRASKHRWLWIFVLLLMATLLVFVALHGVEHALEGGDVLLCATIASLVLVLLVPSRIEARTTRMSVARDPPLRFARIAAAIAPTGLSPPLRL
jgi:hypothetical protein